VSAITVALAVYVCSLATFAMTKMRLPLKKVYFTVIIATLMFSPSVTQISSYVIVTELRMVNTLAALIVPKIAGSYFFFLLKQNMEQIPNALVESAKQDGCGLFSVYTRIILPLSKPVLATVVVFAFIASWNDFYSPLIYINKQALKTLPLALQMLQGGSGQVARSGAMAAAALLTTFPTIVIFLLMQSKVVKTMAHTGIK
jgi:ABC-type glycerol-3-phosphate transport system permease component